MQLESQFASDDHPVLAVYRVLHQQLPVNTMHVHIQSSRYLLSTEILF